MTVSNSDAAGDDPGPSPASGVDTQLLSLIHAAALQLRRRAESVPVAADEEAAHEIADAVWEAVDELQEAALSYLGRVWNDDADDLSPLAPSAGSVVLDVIGRWRYEISDTARLNEIVAALDQDCVPIDGRPETALAALLDQHPAGDLPDEAALLLQSRVDIIDADETDFEGDEITAAINARAHELEPEG